MSNRLLRAYRSACVFAFLVLAVVSAAPAAAQQVKIGDLVLNHAWARATPGGAKVGGGYLIIENRGATPDKLIGGSSLVAGKVEVHEMAMHNGVITMRAMKDGLSIPAGQSVTLAPGGYHIMLMDLKSPLKRGDKVPVTLTFEKAGDIKVVFEVQSIGAMDPPSGRHHTMPDTQQPMKMNSDHKM
jgi:copper(I)-binding protein